MPLVYLTGLSGSGKSSVTRELERRGFEALGVDEDVYADWVHRETGDVAVMPHGNGAPDIHAWYGQYRWVLSAERITALKAHADATNTVVFLAGIAEGDDTVWHLFDRVIVLSVDEGSIRHRVNVRTDNHFGKAPEEMAEILTVLDGFDDKYRALGAVVVDATQPLDDVVAAVISAVATT